MAQRLQTAVQRLLHALRILGSERPDIAWTYCLASELLIVERQVDQARLGAELCAQLCEDPSCRNRVQSLQERLSGASGAFCVSTARTNNSSGN